MHLDGTVIDSKGHIDICPVSFTTSLFTEKATSCNVKAWQLLGYVSDLLNNRGRSGAMNSFESASSKDKGRTSCHFHKVMDVMMADWVKGQAGLDDRLKQVPLKLATGCLLLNLFFPCYLSSMMASMVINFVAESIAITAVYCVTTVQVIARLYEDLDDPEVECKFLSTQTINQHASQRSSQEELCQLSIYKCDNAFNHFQMGWNPHGIFVGAFVDVMHTIQQGINMYMHFLKASRNASVHSHWQCLTPWLSFLTPHAVRVFTCPSPELIFQRNNKTSPPWWNALSSVGLLFLVFFFILQAEGWEVIDKYFLQLDSVFGTILILLCFEQWLDQYTFWDIGDSDGEAAEAQAAIASLMNLITTYLPQAAGTRGGKKLLTRWLTAVSLLQ